MAEITGSTFYRCECLGMDFTRDQWRDYVAEHPRLFEEVVSKHGEFSFNVYDFCVNPHLPVVVRAAGCRANIWMVRYPCGAWDYGATLCYPKEHTPSRAPRYLTDPADGFETERLAVEAGFRWLEDTAIDVMKQEAARKWRPRAQMKDGRGRKKRRPNPCLESWYKYLDDMNVNPAEVVSALEEFIAELRRVRDCYLRP